MKRLMKIAAFLLSGVTVVSMAACSKGSGEKAGADASYTMWNYVSTDPSYYMEYGDNPALLYALSKKWGPENKKISIDFWGPAPGSESDSYQTMIASGDYPDILDGVIAESALNLYEQDIIMDITDYVKKYMPNYDAYLETHPEIKPYAAFDVNGEERILSITSVYDAYDYYFCGYQYRRDWIVKYGVHPETGTAFTGGYTDASDVDSWVDDVVFPSGGTHPVYISDWEWMFDIFTRAQEALSIQESYSISMYYPGYTWSGGLCSSFGGGMMTWFKNKEGKVEFGGVTEQIRAYLECLNTWYKKGWLDQEFNERTGDVHYAIDDVSVRQGKVGMWMGLQSQLGRRMDIGDELTSGICVYGCAFPVNDIYGTDACKFKEPDCIMGSSLIGIPYYITTAAKGKDLAAICSFFDYFYTEEGAKIRSLGLNAEQAAEINSKFYKEWGLENGAYTVGEDGRYQLIEILQKDGGSLKGAVKAEKTPGITLITSIDNGYADTLETSLKSWIQYQNTGCFVGSLVVKNMPNNEAKICDDTLTKILGYMEQKAPDMIKGKLNPYDDGDWNTWCTMLNKFNFQKAADLYQPYVDKYPF